MIGGDLQDLWPSWRQARFPLGAWSKLIYLMQVTGAPTVTRIIIKSWPGAETHQGCDLFKYPCSNDYPFALHARCVCSFLCPLSERSTSLVYRKIAPLIAPEVVDSAGAKCRVHVQLPSSGRTSHKVRGAASPRMMSPIGQPMGQTRI